MIQKKCSLLKRVPFCLNLLFEESTNNFSLVQHPKDCSELKVVELFCVVLANYSFYNAGFHFVIYKCLLSTSKDLSDLQMPRLIF